MATKYFSSTPQTDPCANIDAHLGIIYAMLDYTPERLIHLMDKINRGEATQEEHNLVLSWGERHFDSHNSSYSFEGFFMSHGEEILACWNDKEFNPLAVKYDRSLILLFSAFYSRSDIANGGFLQYFQNHTGRMALEACEGFDLIELGDCAGVLRTAIACFGDPFPRNDSLRIDIAANQQQELSSLDEEFYAVCPDSRFADAAERCFARITAKN